MKLKNTILKKDALTVAFQQYNSLSTQLDTLRQTLFAANIDTGKVHRLFHQLATAVEQQAIKTVGYEASKLFAVLSIPIQQPEANIDS